ncbi:MULTISPECIES: EAL domain-containing response regulator [Pseudomonadota]|uniref:EAL domain-containing response regulator n=1 Tax=Pseudomonadota TaxID=1224 RepID=UPI0008A25BA1|nr:MULTISPECIES: EAL domain-containing response regulator [Pseudomonadota]MBJ9965617.1 EAL domain-containing response regulator [Burkholderia seminalis]MDN7586830.1 EAL domain-containing response regulator [Burkholderia seminalis]OFU89050.1 diguanylate phosphodiesterase [Stenotrophomonas sp. HMSC10F07]
MSFAILIVEDQAFQRGFIANLFSAHAGLRVDACDSAQSAIAMCNCQSYDLVVTDLLMPDHDGIQLIQELAARSNPPRLALVSATSRRMMSAARLMAESLGLTVLGLLPKPVAASDVDALLDALALSGDVQKGTEPTRVVPIEATREELQRALAEGRITAWFQPKKSLTSGAVVAAEALVRWEHPQRGILLPGTFLSAVHAHGLDEALLVQVLKASVQAQKRWRKLGFHIPVSINLPPHLLEHADLPDRLLALTQQWGGTPSDLCFELMESSTTHHVSDYYAGACRLRMKGFGLAQDDFGQGLSSVHNLVNTPFTEVKIDRALVHGCAASAALQLTLSTVITLANRLGLTIVAEGVEAEADLAALRRLGCDVVQGFFISQALPLDGFARLLSEERSASGGPSKLS